MRSSRSTIAALSACAVLAGCSSAPVAEAPVVRIAEAAKPSPSRALDLALPTTNELATILGTAGFTGQLVKGGPEMLLQGVRESEATPIDCVSTGYRLQKIVYQASPVQSVASQSWIGGDQAGPSYWAFSERSSSPPPTPPGRSSRPQPTSGTAATGRRWCCINPSAARTG